MTQETAFMSGEGDAWFERNKEKLGTGTDPVLYCLLGLTGLPKDGKCLEIGCSNGWRLKEIKKITGLRTYGVDPSQQAIEEAKNHLDEARVGSAGHLYRSYSSIHDASFDIVIFGFCLYLVDRKDLFRSIYEADRLTKNGGLIVVYDFATNFPCKNPYKHKEGLWSYKQDYSQMFLASPTYSHVTDYINMASDPPVKVTVMRKSLERGYPSCD